MKERNGEVAAWVTRAPCWASRASRMQGACGKRTFEKETLKGPDSQGWGRPLSTSQLAICLPFTHETSVDDAATAAAPFHNPFPLFLLQPLLFPIPLMYLKFSDPAFLSERKHEWPLWQNEKPGSPSACNWKRRCALFEARPSNRFHSFSLTLLFTWWHE